MWDKFFYVGIKAAVLFTKGLHCMHWHARVARSVVLALSLLMTQTTLFAVNNVAHSQVPFLVPRFVGHDQGRFRSEKKLPWRQGSPKPWWAAPVQQAQRQTVGLAVPTAGFDPFL